MSVKSKLKGAWRSRTIWFNSISGVILTALPEMKEVLPSLQQYITPHVYQWLIVVVVIGNIWLRAITTASLEDKEKP